MRWISCWLVAYAASAEPVGGAETAEDVESVEVDIAAEPEVVPPASSAAASPPDGASRFAVTSNPYPEGGGVKATFSQVAASSAYGTKTIEGEVQLGPDGKITWDIPGGGLVVSNGDTTWVADKDRERVLVLSEPSTAATLRSVLQNLDRLTEAFEVLELEPETEEWCAIDQPVEDLLLTARPQVGDACLGDVGVRTKLIPRDPASRVAAAYLAYDQRDGALPSFPTRVRVIDDLGNVDDLQWKSVGPVDVLDANDFEYEPPVDAEVTEL